MGFEGALGEIQLEAKNTPSQENKNRLNIFDKILLNMFNDMDKGFRSIGNSVENSIQKFLYRFNSIFTLNQDSLLERCVSMDMSSNKQLGSPCMVPNKPWGVFQCDQKNDELPEYCPQTTNFEINNNHNTLPYFKLHGSYNWRNSQQERLLIMGSSKEDIIKLHPILEFYQKQFSEHLSKPNTHLMIIGYGFRDEHINVKLVKAAKERNLRIYLIDPSGTDIIPAELQESLRPVIIGASRRPLRDIFESDQTEYNKVMNFF